VPTYDYRCEDCGGFSARQPLALYDQPASCPACGVPSPRALSAPAAWAMPRRGDARAAASPAGTQEAGGYRRLRHGGGCACCPR
jgi:putative FmdB family regulatory protein